MVDSDRRRQILAELLDPTPKTAFKIDPKKRPRRCKSAPLTEFLQPHPCSESQFRKASPRLWEVPILLLVYLGVGTVCFYLVGNQITGKKINGVLDSVYFCIVTMTTVGYGDLVPNSVASKLLACAFVFSGMSLVCLILSKGADYLVEKQEYLLVKAMHMRNKVGQSEIVKEAETYKVRYKCILSMVILVFLIILGTVFLVKVEKLEVVDAFYCVCCTITTLGYGDESFSTKAGRIFAIVWILTSTLCLAQFFLYVAEVNTEARQKELVKFCLTRRMTNQDLEAADMDNDGVLGAAEFIIYKLTEMGKITQEDVSSVMEEFENLDVDQSGTLSISDLNLAQSLTR